MGLGDLVSPCAAVKRSPLIRKTSLKRSPMRRRTRSTKYARRERDMPRMGWTKEQHCILNLDALMSHQIFMDLYQLWSGPLPDDCSGIIEAHHAGVRGLGQKAPDSTCLPLCSAHHRDLTDRSGCFASWPRGMVKAWELAVVAVYQRLYAGHLAAKEAGTW